MLVVQAGLQHDRVEREHPGVIGDHQRRPGAGHVTQPAHLDPEPLLVQQPGQRDQQPGVEFGVEAELVNLTLTGDLAEGEPERVAQPPAPVVTGAPRRRGAWKRTGRKLPRASLPAHLCPSSAPAAPQPASRYDTRGASAALLLVAPLYARLPQQLAMLLLRHPLTALLDDGAHDTTLTRESGQLACDVFARCQPAGPTPTPQGTCPAPAPVMSPRGTASAGRDERPLQIPVHRLLGNTE